MKIIKHTLSRKIINFPKLDIIAEEVSIPRRMELKIITTIMLFRTNLLSRQSISNLVKVKLQFLNFIAWFIVFIS